MNNQSQKYKPSCQECSSKLCNYYQKIFEENACVWGNEVFYLLETKNPEKCLIKDKNPPEDYELIKLSELEEEARYIQILENRKLFN